MPNLSYTITHLLLPGYSNNQKAKIIHSESIIGFVFLLVVGQYIISHLSKVGISVLGYASQISTGEVIKLTNDKRMVTGEPPLAYSPELAEAAKAKGEDMLAKGYWAHVAPDGTQPWKFFNDVGYKYRYAGENLAKDFPTPQEAIDAWMASPTHRDNMLSSKYDEVGVAVVEGDLNGVDTTIIIQLFGKKYDTTIASATTDISAASGNGIISGSESITPEVTAVLTPTQAPMPTLVANGSIASLREVGKPSAFQVLISPFSTKKGYSAAATSILLITFTIDAVFILKRKTARIGGKTLAHIIFLTMILVIVVLLQSGEILPPLGDSYG